MPSVLDTPILHVDLDAFFASVEVLDDPSLAGRPVAVGGAGERGVIASASYEARRFGVRSAMPSVVARRHCPSLVILPGRFGRYEEVSRAFLAIVNDLTPHYEPIGLDEVFADLRSLSRLGTEPESAGRALRQRVEDELNLRCGVGVARNKLFAKLASKKAKPQIRDGRLVEGPGVVCVTPEIERAWLDELPVSALWGVGPATTAKLRGLGLNFVRDLARVGEPELVRQFGRSLGATLSAYAKGEDRREVESDRVNRSVGHDQTFARSLAGIGEVRVACARHAEIVARALREGGRVARTVTVVLRFDDLTSVSRSQTLPFGVDDERAIGEVAIALCESVELRQSVRLLAVHASGLGSRDTNEVQLSFGVEDDVLDARRAATEASRERQVAREALRDVIDEVRQRYGDAALASASDLTDEGLRVDRQRGRDAFGPADGNVRPGGR